MLFRNVFLRFESLNFLHELSVEVLLEAKLVFDLEDLGLVPRFKVLELLIRDRMALLTTDVSHLFALKLRFKQIKLFLCDSLRFMGQILPATIAKTLVLPDVAPVQIRLRGEKLPHDSFVIIAISVHAKILNFGFQLKNFRFEFWDRICLLLNVVESILKFNHLLGSGCQITHLRVLGYFPTTILTKLLLMMAIDLPTLLLHYRAFDNIFQISLNFAANFGNFTFALTIQNFTNIFHVLGL